jgi:hypothetical protein
MNEIQQAEFMQNQTNSSATLIYQLIYNNDMAKQKDRFERSPTLDTVLMVEKSIEQHSGEFNRTELWKKLPRQVMWQTYLVILDYLESINKIAFDRESKVAYIWNPELAKLLRKRKEIKL